MHERLDDAQRTMATRPQMELAHLPFDPARRLPPTTRDHPILGEFGQEGLMKSRPRLRGE